MSFQRRLVVVGLLAAVAFGCERSGPPSGGPAPAFDYAEGSEGCGLFLVYRPNAAQSEAFVVHVDLDKVGLKEGAMTFDLSTPREGVSVTVEVYPRPQKMLHHCQDISDPDGDAPVVWTAVAGKLTVERLPPEKKGDGPATFRVKGSVEGAEFREPRGRTARCPQSIAFDAVVGWFAG